MKYNIVSLILASIPESYEIILLKAGLLTYARLSSLPILPVKQKSG